MFLINLRWGDGSRNAGLTAFQRQVDIECRALALTALNRDRAAHHLGQLTTDRQAQSGTAESARRGIVGLNEFLKQSGLLLAGNADARVADHQQQSTRRSIDVKDRTDPAGMGELDRVG